MPYLKRTFGSSDPGQVTFQRKSADHVSLNPFIKFSLPGKYSRVKIPCGLVHPALKTGPKANVMNEIIEAQPWIISRGFLL